MTRESNEAKRTAEKLWAESEERFAVGDYVASRMIAAKLIRTAPDSEIVPKAEQRVLRLGTVDPAGWYALAGAIGVYLFAWAFAWA